MLRMRPCTAFLGLCLVLSTSCGDESSDGGAPKKFKGATYHLDVVGKLGDDDINVHLTSDEAGDVERAFCEREYAYVPDPEDESTWGAGKWFQVELVTWAEIGGEERLLRFEFKRHPFGEDSDGDELTVVPRDDTGLPASNELWIEVEMEDAEGNELVEAAAQSGKMVFGHHTGTPGPDGVVVPAGEGAFGAWFEAHWSVSERVTASFYVKCNALDFDDP